MSEEKFRQTENIFQRLLKRYPKDELQGSMATFDLNDLLEKVMSPLQAVAWMASWVDWRNGDKEDQS
ncbi:MAG: hypothetical protein IT416_03840 [Candidatus Pacebacteria bacterium]|nr:hypothetical protein [Candidatus Paceibacterota bacterium]